MDDNLNRQSPESNEARPESNSSNESSTSRLSQEAFDPIKCTATNADSKSPAGSSDMIRPMSAEERNAINSQMMHKLAEMNPSSIDQGKHADAIWKEKIALPNLVISDDKLPPLSDQDRQKIVQTMADLVGKPADINQGLKPRSVVPGTGGGGGGSEKPQSRELPGGINLEPILDKIDPKLFGTPNGLKQLKNMRLPGDVDTNLIPTKPPLPARVLELRKRDSD